MGKDIIIDSRYQGYVFLGWAMGQFETKQGEMMPYFNDRNILENVVLYDWLLLAATVSMPLPFL